MYGESEGNISRFLFDGLTTFVSHEIKKKVVYLLSTTDDGRVISVTGSQL